VDIEADVEHGCLLKSLNLGNAATEFQVTRLTGASFIVSTPKQADPMLLRSISAARAPDGSPPTGPAKASGVCRKRKKRKFIDEGRFSACSRRLRL
jgi:hypothetical protein